MDNIDRINILLRKKITAFHCQAIVGNKISFINVIQKGQPALFFEFQHPRKVIVKCTFFVGEEKKTPVVSCMTYNELMQNHILLEFLNDLLLRAGEVNWNDIEKRIGKNLNRII